MRKWIRKRAPDISLYLYTYAECGKARPDTPIAAELDSSVEVSLAQQIPRAFIFFLHDCISTSFLKLSSTNVLNYKIILLFFCASLPSAQPFKRRVAGWVGPPSQAHSASSPGGLDPPSSFRSMTFSYFNCCVVRFRM